MAHEDENKKAWEKGGAKYNRYEIVYLLCHYHPQKADLAFASQQIIQRIL